MYKIFISSSVISSVDRCSVSTIFIVHVLVQALSSDF